MPENILLIILFAMGISQGLFWVIALVFTERGNRVANYYLATLTFIFTLNLVDYLIYLTGTTENWRVLELVIWPKDFFYGPLVYLYVRGLTQPHQAALAGKQWCHFLPALYYVTVSWSLLLLTPEQQMTIFTVNEAAQSGEEILYELLLAPIDVAAALQMAVYLFISFRLLYRHQRVVRQAYSDIERINLDWLKNLLIGLSALYAIWIFVLIFLNANSLSLTMFGGGIVLLIYSMAFLGLRQPVIFRQQDGAVLSADENDPKSNNGSASTGASESEKYKNSSLTPELSATLLEELTDYMRDKKPYLNSQLSLPELAEQLRVSSHYLSQVINQQSGQNFFDFVNQYRINDAKQTLLDPGQQRKSVTSIAMDVGFNSKSAFYSAFKKFTNMTPSQYRKSISQ